MRVAKLNINGAVAGTSVKESVWTLLSPAESGDRKE